MAVDLAVLTEAYPGYKTAWGAEQYVFSAQGKSLEHGRKADDVDGTGYGTRVKNMPPGQQEGKLKIDGLAAMKRLKVSYLLNKWFGRQTTVKVWFAPENLNVGSPVTLQPSYLKNNTVSTKLKDANEFKAEFDAAGLYGDGVILIGPKTLVPGVTFLGVADDNTSDGGATTFGGFAQLHLIALTAGTTPTVTVKIQHSIDLGVTWVDLPSGSFGSVNSIGGYLVQIPSTTLVNAQVRGNVAVTGTPTEVQMLLGWVRGLDPDL